MKSIREKEQQSNTDALSVSRAPQSCASCPASGSYKFLQRQADCLECSATEGTKGAWMPAPSTEEFPCSVTKYPKLQAELLGGNCCLYIPQGKLERENLRPGHRSPWGGMFTA